eukprot:12530609-Ditylum_brightwellii.AAC.1
MEDLLPLPSCDYGDVVGENFERAWEKQQRLHKSAAAASGNKKLNDLSNISNTDDENQGTTKVRRALLEVMGRKFLYAGILKA